MDHERARGVLHELHRKLLLMVSERKAAKRREIFESIFNETRDAPFEEQCIEKQLKILLELNE